MPEENPLAAYFENNDRNLIHKLMHYFDIYHRYFARYRGTPATILEFGVSHGGSLQMWKDYFGPEAKIIGVDIDPHCKELEEPQVSIYIGDQEDRQFLGRLMSEIGPVDVVIDDGGHTMTQQITTFEEVYPKIKQDGVFMVEDLHTSYWEYYGGGYRRPGTFIEYAKGLIDELNAWHSSGPADFKVTDYTRTTRSMHVYDSVVVFEKARVTPPVSRYTGRETIPED